MTNPSVLKSKPKPRRRRRSQQEILDLLVDAACKEFQENGYSRATTAAIAKRADVIEALIFKHFGSKSRLFEAAVFKPLNEHFLAFNDAHLAELSNEDRDVESQKYIEELYAFLNRHARMLMTFAVEQTYRGASEGDVEHIDGLEAYFDRASSLGARYFKDGDPSSPMLMARISFLSIMSCVIFQDWLLPPSIASKEQIRTAVGDFVLHGISSRRTSRQI